MQAYLLLGIKRAAILTLNFKRLSKNLEQKVGQVSHQPLDEQQRNRAEDIGWAVTVASRYTLWNSNCLTRTLTAQRMLRKSHIPGTFYLGTRKEQHDFEAHAWLQCGNVILIGERGHETYTVLSSFTWT